MAGRPAAPSRSPRRQRPVARPAARAQSARMSAQVTPKQEVSYGQAPMPELWRARPRPRKLGQLSPVHTRARPTRPGHGNAAPLPAVRNRLHSAAGWSTRLMAWPAAHFRLACGAPGSRSPRPGVAARLAVFGKPSQLPPDMSVNRRATARQMGRETLTVHPVPRGQGASAPRAGHLHVRQYKPPMHRLAR